jgi:hypothetical protein
MRTFNDLPAHVRRVRGKVSCRWCASPARGLATIVARDDPNDRRGVPLCRACIAEPHRTWRRRFRFAADD